MFDIKGQCDPICKSLIYSQLATEFLLHVCLTGLVSSDTVNRVQEYSETMCLINGLRTRQFILSLG